MASEAKNESIAPVYVVHGPDEYLKREAVNQIVRTTLAPDQRRLALSEFDGQTSEPAEVFDELRTLPFLADRRVACLREADGFISRYRSQLEHYLSAPSETGVLVLVCRTFHARTKLYKLAQQVGHIVPCEPPRGRGVAAWLVQQARQRYGKRIDPPAAESLRELIGEQLADLDAELGKLALYAGDRPRITSRDVEALVGQHRQEKVFRITDAIAHRDASGALRLWQQVWATDRAAPARAIGGLRWAVKRMLDARKLHDSGVPLGQVAGRVRMPAHLLERQLAGLSRKRLEQQLERLLQADLAAKTGAGTVQRAIEKFIVEQCGAPE